MKITLNTDWPWPTSAKTTSDAKWAAALLPPNRPVVVACGGAALMALPVRKVEVVNDLRGDVHNFYRVVRDAQSRRELLELIDAGTAPVALLAAVRPNDPILAAYHFYHSCHRTWVPDMSSR